MSIRDVVSYAYAAHNTAAAAALETCHQTCMTWPRDQDPAQYSWLDPQGYENNFNSNMGGDIFACRQKHLSLISDDRNEAAFHCPHATNPSTAICRDSFVNGYTPYELQRQGQQTRHRVGYCDLSGQNTIADCVDQNLDDESFVQALQFLPATVQIIFMSGNPTITDGSLGITKLTEDIFKANLKSPSTVQAIYLNDNSIADIHENALRGLVNLKIFCINMNPLPSIPGKLFQYSPNLLQFEYFMTGQGDNTALSEFPVDLFSNTKKIERIVIYGHKRVTSLPSGLLDGLSNLNIFTIVDSGLTSDGIPDDLFHDCTSLQFWDFFGNSMTTFDGRWFNGIWEKNLIRVAMWGQCIPDPDTMTIDTTTAFDGMDSIQFVYFHDNAGVVIDPAIFADKKDFVALTFTGDRLTSFCPPP
jgi:hypothetical protein